MQKQRAHQAAFMTYAFGGANEYAGRDMAAAHRHLIPHLTEEHFNAVVENFVATLQELGVAQAEIDDACKVVATTKEAVLAE
ncbi:putative myoglobin [Scenedesmus sp. NREL 46B-D3]|nr:putative myoglobin [Scenedesmus sp. NREL 46B-D3]